MAEGSQEAGTDCGKAGQGTIHTLGRTGRLQDATQNSRDGKRTNCPFPELSINSFRLKLTADDWNPRKRNYGWRRGDQWASQVPSHLVENYSFPGFLLRINACGFVSCHSVFCSRDVNQLRTSGREEITFFLLYKGISRNATGWGSCQEKEGMSPQLSWSCLSVRGSIFCLF